MDSSIEACLVCTHKIIERDGVTGAPTLEANNNTQEVWTKKEAVVYLMNFYGQSFQKDSEKDVEGNTHFQEDFDPSRTYFCRICRELVNQQLTKLRLAEKEYLAKRASIIKPITDTALKTLSINKSEQESIQNYVSVPNEDSVFLNFRRRIWTYQTAAIDNATKNDDANLSINNNADDVEARDVHSSSTEGNNSDGVTMDDVTSDQEIQESPLRLPTDEERSTMTPVEKNRICDACSRKFVRPNLVEKHKNKDHSIDPNRPLKSRECTICGWVFYNKSQNTKHFNTHHSTEKRQSGEKNQTQKIRTKPKAKTGPPKSKAEERTCAGCKRVFNKRNIMLRHEKNCKKRNGKHDDNSQ